MPPISGETKLLGLLGRNTPYTLSPALHNHALKLNQLDQVYVNFDLPEDSVASFLDVFWNLGGMGLNVTKPYKSLVASLVSGCDLESVNTLVRGEHGWKCYSTDGAGFARGLKKIHCEAEDVSHLVLLGNGGSSQAIAKYFLSLSNTALKSLQIMRRSHESDALFLKMKRRPSVELKIVDWSVEDFKNCLKETPDSTLLVQATSAPSHGDDLRELLPALQKFNGYFTDIVYDKPSSIYFELLNRGQKSQDGLSMLIEQARLSQELWWGKSASYEELAKALKQTQYFLKS